MRSPKLRNVIPTQLKEVRGLGGRFRGLIVALFVSNAVSVVLFMARTVRAENERYGFMLWNLFLAWLPLLFSWLVVERLRSSSWITPVNLILTLLWLGFLPNSFYMVSDLIHLHDTGEVGLLYDSAMFFSFIFNGFVVGIMSLILIHRALLKRVRRRDAHSVVGIILMGCGFAIYLGRYLRWNTWDILVHPAGLLFDVTDRIADPLADTQALATTTVFSLLLGSIYLVAWQVVNVISDDHTRG